MEGGQVLILLTTPSALERSEYAGGGCNVFKRKHSCDNGICPRCDRSLCRWFEVEALRTCLSTFWRKRTCCVCALWLKRARSCQNTDRHVSLKQWFSNFTVCRIRTQVVGPQHFRFGGSCKFVFLTSSQVNCWSGDDTLRTITNKKKNSYSVKRMIHDRGGIWRMLTSAKLGDFNFVHWNHLENVHNTDTWVTLQ